MIDLKSILKQHPDCLNSRASFKSVLMDKYPSEKRMVNILTILFECGVAKKIKTKQIIDVNDIQNLVTQVKNEYGIMGEYTEEAVCVWAEAFDVKVPLVKVCQYFEDIYETRDFDKEKNITYVEGNVEEYEISDRKSVV